MAGERRSRTAQGVLAERALLHDMGVIDDPYARSMLRPAMAAVYRLARRWPDRVPTLRVTLAGLATRVAWHDAQVLSALDDGIRQVVIVGAGYDSRAWRLARDGVTWCEVDHPATQQDKIRRAPGPGPAFVPLGLRTGDVAEALRNHGLDPDQRAIFVLEGLTMYLDADTVRRLLTDLASATAPGSRLSTDVYPPPDAGSTLHQRQNRLQRLARAGSGEGLRLLLDRDAAVALVTDAGWEVTEVRGGADAPTLVPVATDLPLDSVNPGKTLLAAQRPADG